MNLCDGKNTARISVTTPSYSNEQTEWKKITEKNKNPPIESIQSWPIFSKCKQKRTVSNSNSKLMDVHITNLNIRQFYWDSFLCNSTSVSICFNFSICMYAVSSVCASSVRLYFCVSHQFYFPFFFVAIVGWKLHYYFLLSDTSQRERLRENKKNGEKWVVCKNIAK